VREGQAPQTRREISSQLPARKEATWSRRKKEGRVRHDEEQPACTDRINHMALKPFAFILWCHVTVHHCVTSGTRRTSKSKRETSQGKRGSSEEREAHIWSIFELYI
jgi:hypothetical protein